MARLTAARLADIKVEAWLAAVRQYRPLIARIIAQTERRVLDGEQVPAADKLVSLFEPHTDIIVKGSREVQYGHKLNLSTGKTGMILDLVIEDGNPADTDRVKPMLRSSQPRRWVVERTIAWLRPLPPTGQGLG